jgi:magnesium-transporting ATPase (P-type)
MPLLSQSPDEVRNSTLPDIILTWFIQVVGVIAAIVFGVFAVLSWTEAQDDAKRARDQAEAFRSQANTANLIALAAICVQHDSIVRRSCGRSMRAYTDKSC